MSVLLLRTQTRAVVLGSMRAARRSVPISATERA
jgi:hypothetical protein